MKNKLFFTLILIIIFIFGFFFKDFSLKYKILDCQNNYCYERGWQDAKKIVDDKMFGNDAGNIIDRKFFSGKIKKIYNNKLIIENKNLSLLPNKELLFREVIIDNNTIIDILTEKDKESYNNELIKFKEKNIKKNGPNIPEEYPNKYYYKKIDFNELKIGQSVFIQANENIVNKKFFKASIIRVIE